MNNKEIMAIQASAELIYTAEQVELAINDMAEKMNCLLNDRNPVILTVMNGGMVVAGQLLTRLDFPLTIDSIYASRYGQHTTGNDIHWLHTPQTSLDQRTVLIIDDILDQGLTLEAIIHYCQEQGATSVYTAVLINKKLAVNKPVIADFVGLETEDKYLFGYGMDYKGYLRNAAGIYQMRRKTSPFRAEI